MAGGAHKGRGVTLQPRQMFPEEQILMTYSELGETVGRVSESVIGTISEFFGSQDNCSLVKKKTMECRKHKKLTFYGHIFYGKSYRDMRNCRG